MPKLGHGFRIKGFYRNNKKEEFVSKTVYPTMKEALENKDNYSPAYKKTRIVYK